MTALRSSTMCLLDGVKRSVKMVVPESWIALVFGSVSRCSGTQSHCEANLLSADVDLVLVYPPNEVPLALTVRSKLANTLSCYGYAADIVLLNSREFAAGGFETVTDARPIACPRMSAESD
jgi:hypothetical protein